MPDGAARLSSVLEVPDGLSWCNDDQPGLSRRRSGQGFSYRGRDGQPIRDARTLDRIRALAIPPAWSEVWICPRANGHIQATGRDLKGRKQYRYHTDWTRHAANAKFDRLSVFARKLPKLREQVEQDLTRRGPCRDKVLATAVRLLEITLIRVGNAEYARQNRSFGLTTLHKRHLEVDGAALTFEFRGKSGKDHRISVRDQRLARAMRTLEGLPGQHLFKYRDAQGDLHPVTSDDVNAYIRDAMGEQFSAKDFRTWAGTVSAARALRDMEPPTSPTDARRKITLCVKAVSGLLGNTPTVCRAAYVHPRVLDLFENGGLAAALPGAEAKGFEPSLIRLLSPQ
ncbi:DNA topoisomerase-1 [Brevundimonas bullata]|uniref:DNA topoisomerase n=1 Tax=Brevundimonas bullata TaxID=13160 RepID=A0A7W7IRH6_9CAUL|nr:DNA topoisomerase IB [Brevundimonas bullata]MBB4799169.1 DNA topoisomerase-1 [Brevundimonas bullata]MBB6384137.1 DNA topoisomerase-1 [Brevundimonas bullata]